MNDLNFMKKLLDKVQVDFYTIAELEVDKCIALGRGNVISKIDISNTPGTYPVYSSSAKGNGIFGMYGKYMFEDERITWSIDGGGRFFYRKPHKYSLTNVSGWLKVLNKNKINTRYLYYVLSGAWETKKFDYIKKAHPSIIRKEYSVPIPYPNNPQKSLEIQSEIVGILDTFTMLSAELSTELSVELSTRKKQFSYYREQLFSFYKEDVKRKPLNKVGEIIRGKRFTKANYVDDGISAIHYADIYTHYGTATTNTVSNVHSDLKSTLRFAKPGDIVIAGVGETVEDIGKSVAWLGKENVAIHDDCFAFSHSLNPKFVSYYFQTAKFNAEKRKFVARGKMKRLSAKNFGKLTIPIPPSDEQNRIVTILDKFDTLTTSISEGLSKEIELRKKQYEYYRDMLLTFPKENLKL